MSADSSEGNENTDENVILYDLSASVALKRVSVEGGLSPPQAKKIRETISTMPGTDNGGMQHDVFQVAESSGGEGESTCSLLENSDENLTKETDKQSQDIIRLIGHYLKTIGLERSAESLTKEAGCSLDHPAALKFCNDVMQGRWSDVQEDLLILKEFLDETPEKWNKIKFMVLEQKYLEFLDDGRVVDAMNVLREELSPLQYDANRVHELCSFMICNSWELRVRALWSGKCDETRGHLVDKVRACLPPTIMLPPDRLRILLSQALEHQKTQCLYHNTLRDGLDNISLLADHQCTADQLPCETIQLIHDHSDEVWFCKFSPDGLKLATASKDSNVIIWDVNVETLSCTRSWVLGDHPFGVAFVAWSPNSQSIITCGHEGSTVAWIWQLEGDEPLCYTFEAPGHSLTACAWYGDGSFIIGGSHGQFSHCDHMGRVLSARRGSRATFFCCRKDGATMLVSDTHRRIKSFLFDENSDFHILTESFPIMSFSVSDNDRLVLLDMANQGIHLWDLKDRILIRKFQGHIQSLFTINSCFGGVNQDFIASGSEDGRVCIWNIKNEFPIAELIGHTDTVNCVSWNPRFHQMLASASDDRTVRIWAPICIRGNQEQEKSCNSTSLESTCSEQLHSPVTGDKTTRVHGSSAIHCIVPQESKTTHCDPPGDDSSSLHLMDTSESSGVILENINFEEKQMKRLIEQDTPEY